MVRLYDRCIFRLRLHWGHGFVIIWDAVPFDNKLDFSECEVGEIVDFFDGKFILKLVDGILLVKDFECSRRLKKGIVLK